jgi:hypothetical protein
MSVREQILERLRHRPFQPFRLVLSNGHTHDIRHPDMAWVSPYYILVGIPDPDFEGPSAISSSIMLSMIHITEVEPIAKKSKPTK